MVFSLIIVVILKNVKNASGDSNHKKGLISKALTDLQGRHEQLQFRVPACTRDAEPDHQLIITLCSPLCIHCQQVRQEFSLTTIQKATPESLSIAQDVLTSMCSTFSCHYQLVKSGRTATVNPEQHNSIHCISEFRFFIILVLISFFLNRHSHLPVFDSPFQSYTINKIQHALISCAKNINENI